ncbi:MAG: FeoB-associated Cys-rich membrane protein [Muribaculaceae bacterium]|nr:FeoB-associated Cys-rich membrane protein [Muribaculaceae bacterium]
MSLTVQYIIVGVILSAAAIWIAVKLQKKKRGKTSECLGCGLYETCSKLKKEGNKGSAG